MSGLEADAISLVRGGRSILDAVSFSVGPSQFAGIAGPNGSGKSTLLRALSGIWPVAEGKVLLDGVPLRQHTRKQIARSIAYVPQETRFDFGFTVREIVAMGRHPHRSRFAAESSVDAEAIHRAIVTCDIMHLSGRLVTTLSGGERQRVCIARGLAGEPRFLLLDEPTASLDVEHALQIFRLCRRLADSGCAIALCTHDLNGVVRFAHSVTLLKDGAIAWSGPSSEISRTEAIADVFNVRTELIYSTAGEPVFVFYP